MSPLLRGLRHTTFANAGHYDEFYRISAELSLDSRLM